MTTHTCFVCEYTHPFNKRAFSTQVVHRVSYGTECGVLKSSVCIFHQHLTGRIHIMFTRCASICVYSFRIYVTFVSRRTDTKLCVIIPNMSIIDSFVSFGTVIIALQIGGRHRRHLRRGPIASHVDVHYLSDTAGLPGDQNRRSERVRFVDDWLFVVRTRTGVFVLHFRQSAD